MYQLQEKVVEDNADSREQPFVFVDEKSIALFELACKVAKTAVPVLVSGPTGAGKEIIAKVIHESSPRADASFVALNCAAIPASLAEAEAEEAAEADEALVSELGKLELAFVFELLVFRAQKRGL